MGKNKFLRIQCPKCGNNKVIFGKASTKIRCDRCDYLLTRPTGGKSRVKAMIKKVIWN